MRRDLRGRAERLSEPRRLLGPGHARAADQRGDEPGHRSRVPSAAYPARSEQPQAPSGPGKLSEREREPATMAAQGPANAPIAAQPSISVPTVSPHLDRIRDKTGCRARADLTQLAMTTGLMQPRSAAGRPGAGLWVIRPRTPKGSAGPCPAHARAGEPVR